MGEVVYKYDIGQIVKVDRFNCEIIARRYDRSRKVSTQKKIYECRCLDCNNIVEKTQMGIDKSKVCPVCGFYSGSANKVVFGFNDITTTHPEFINCFANVDDAKNNSHGSGKKVSIVCPLCKNIKCMKISHLIEHGVMCSKCGDGAKYPERLMEEILGCMSVVHERQYVQEWSDGKIYDFFIPSLNMIIETHGAQHYTQGAMSSFNNSRTIEEEQQNDRYKEQLAKDSGIERYVVIDCRKSTLKFIKNSVINSELCDFFDMTVVNWDQCHANTYSNKTMEICKLWNDKETVKELSNKLKLHRSTIVNHLKKGATLGWCKYNPELERKISASKLNKTGTSIVCIELNMEFSTISECCRYFESVGIQMHNANISAVCRGKLKHYKKYTFKYI